MRWACRRSVGCAADSDAMLVSTCLTSQRGREIRRSLMDGESVDGAGPREREFRNGRNGRERRKDLS